MIVPLAGGNCECEETIRRDEHVKADTDHPERHTDLEDLSYAIQSSSFVSQCFHCIRNRFLYGMVRFCCKFGMFLERHIRYIA